MTKYMTEESEHYTGRSKVHKSSAHNWIQNLAEKHKHTRRPSRFRAIYATYFAIEKHVARFLLASGP
jgi:hypothetical protein